MHDLHCLFKVLLSEEGSGEFKVKVREVFCLCFFFDTLSEEFIKIMKRLLLYNDTYWYTIKYI